ncbi:MAG: hypothetical protein ACKOXG_02965 [Arenimonas sp.]
MPTCRVVVILAALCGAGSVGAQAADTLADAVSFHRDVCIQPYYAEKSESALYDEMIAAGMAEPFLARLAVGAPANWRPLADTGVPVRERLTGAIGLVGMAISHGNPREKAVAAAYSAYFIPVPDDGACALPEGLAEYVAQHDFWQ